MPNLEIPPECQSCLLLKLCTREILTVEKEINTISQGLGEPDTLMPHMIADPQELPVKDEGVSDRWDYQHMLELTTRANTVATLGILVTMNCNGHPQSFPGRFMPCQSRSAKTVTFELQRLLGNSN